jgi:branched-chain amino acid transport system substrate-binding protein
VFSIDELSLPRLKELAVGIPGVQEWVNDLPNETNRKFVADYIAKYRSRPSFFAAQSYDAASLLNSAMVAVNGDRSKKDAMRRVMEKAGFTSVRGNFKFGNNHIPIQNFYLQEVARQSDEYVLKTVATIVRGLPGSLPRSLPNEIGMVGGLPRAPSTLVEGFQVNRSDPEDKAHHKTGFRLG